MKPKRPQRKQPTPQELRDRILGFIASHFYQNDTVSFLKDRNMLLKWVVLKLAVYLDEKAVTIGTDRYVEIMIGEKGILMEAVRFGRIEEFKFRPAYLGVVVDRHLAVHGEDYYDEAKAIRNVVSDVISRAQGSSGERDAMRELRKASDLIRVKKAGKKSAAKDQLSLF